MAWELGSNLGHLSRLLPLARRFKAHGHDVLVVARDLGMAAQAFGPVGIPFIQAPQARRPPRLDAQSASYADLLRLHGWADASGLWALVQGWANVIRMTMPQVLVVDHSPTALLAARVTGTPCVIVGTGFEIPPAQQPLPTFPEIAGATLENAVKAESEVLENANRVLEALRGPCLRALSDVFEIEQRWLTTFPELDPYGARSGESYVGPINEVSDGQELEWPAGHAHRIFAYLRTDTPAVDAILSALKSTDAAVICYGPAMSRTLAESLTRPGLIISARAVEIESLLSDASLCVSYSPAGTVTSTLLRGVPQLLAPGHVEAQLTAHKVQCMGAGLTLGTGQTDMSIKATLDRILGTPSFKGHAAAFAERYRTYDPAREADLIASEIERIASRHVAIRKTSVARRMPRDRPATHR
jgi:UDP:flavonoid glycosyltransferase YjiC (YdhE family)